MRKMVGLGAAVLLAASLWAAVVAAPAGAVARGAYCGGGDVIKSGWWGAAHYQLDLSDAGSCRIESDLNVTNAKNGQKWFIRMTDNGKIFFRGTRTVVDHEVEVLAYAVDQPGPDVIKVAAKNLSTGKWYTAQATF